MAAYIRHVGSVQSHNSRVLLPAPPGVSTPVALDVIAVPGPPPGSVFGKDVRPGAGSFCFCAIRASPDAFTISPKSRNDDKGQ